jgi:hypothetical protein
MYKLKYYSTCQTLVVRYFDTMQKALKYSIYSIPFQSFYGIDKVKE